MNLSINITRPAFIQTLYHQTGFIIIVYKVKGLREVGCQLRPYTSCCDNFRRLEILQNIQLIYIASQIERESWRKYSTPCVGDVINVRVSPRNCVTNDTNRTTSVSELRVWAPLKQTLFLFQSQGGQGRAEEIRISKHSAILSSCATYCGLLLTVVMLPTVVMLSTVAMLRTVIVFCWIVWDPKTYQ